LPTSSIKPSIIAQQIVKELPLLYIMFNYNYKMINTNAGDTK